MNSFFSSLKDDLLDRRLLPFVALIAVGFVAALAYALTGGSSSSTPPAAAPRVSVPSGLTVSEAHNSTAAVAETTNGSPVQRQGGSRNPFAALPGSTSTASTSASASKPASSSSSSSGKGSSGASSSESAKQGESSSGSNPSKKESGSSKPATPAKPVTVYKVSILFGVIPPGTAPGSAELTPRHNLKLLAPLPSAKQPLLVFRGVTDGGKEATFTLIGEAILHGTGSCLPSPAQCQELGLKAGQGEQLEYLGATGETVTYELRLVEISSVKGHAASSGLARASKAGLALLRHAGLLIARGTRGGSAAAALAIEQSSHPAPSAEPVAPSRLTR